LGQVEAIRVFARQSRVNVCNRWYNKTLQMSARMNLELGF
jgi:hypothetical protein